MTRRAFLRNAAIATVVAPAIPGAVARVTAPVPRINDWLGCSFSCHYTPEYLAALDAIMAGRSEEFFAAFKREP